jgi:PKD repeat protein
LNYTNSILANSPSGGDCRNDGTIAVHVQNLVESGACSQDIMADPLLGPLLDNGGPTDTQALLMGSPAINAADNSACVADPVNGTDQRGVIRPQADACDIGAYEVEAIAGLTAESDSPTGLGEPTTFTATVTAGESVAYTWNFGDSTIGAGATTKHTFALTGSYEVTATATNAANQMTTTLLVQVIAPVTGLVAENDGPTALGESTHFTATVAGGSDVTYFWDFGDSQSGAGPTPSHTYAAVGTYTAVVTASNVLGSATASTEVVVAEAIAGLTANSNSPTLLGNATTFTATITAGSDVTYTWDFGDSQSGAGAIATHTYTTAGIYAVSVVATNALGSQTVTIAVEVIELSYLIHLPAVWNP